MKPIVSFGCMLVLASSLAVTPVAAGWGPDPDLSAVTVATSGYGPGSLVLLVRPDGQGRSLTDASMTGGVRVDATVSLVLRDALGTPISGYPAEDMWLQTSGRDVVSCGSAWGLPADRDTDQDGRTVWSLPPPAGGWSASGLRVFVNGMEFSPELPIRVVSPDLNGDLVVDLSDAGMFTLDLFGVYRERSDFNNDQVINVSDVGVIATTLGGVCP